MRAVERRRGMNSGGGLPYDYEVEYLQSDGNQYIDTGIQFQLAMEISARVQNTNTTSTNRDRRYFGAATAWLGYGLDFAENAIIVNNKNPVCRTYDVSSAFDFYYKNKSATINGTNFSFDTSGDSESVPTMLLFTSQRPGVVLSTSSIKGRIYYFKVTGYIDLIPVVKNNVPCMYDKLSGNLFYNQGSGSFVAGPNISVINKIKAVMENAYHVHLCYYDTNGMVNGDPDHSGNTRNSCGKITGADIDNVSFVVTPKPGYKFVPCQSGSTARFSFAWTTNPITFNNYTTYPNIGMNLAKSDNSSIDSSLTLWDFISITTV